MFRNTNKVVICVLFALSVSLSGLKAQKSCMFSQYMEFQSATNPAAVAVDDMMSVGGIYRLQWAGMKGSPKDLYFSVAYPFRIGDTNHGVGLIFSSDDIGLFKNRSVLLQYSYKFRLPVGDLSLGMNIGFVSVTFDKEGVDLTGGDGELMSGDDYHNVNDPYISAFTSDGYSDVAFDASFGCMFRTERYYAGLSVLHLSASTVDLGSEKYQMYVPRTFHVMGGYTFETHNPLWKITPSAQVATDFKDWQAELTGMFEYKDRVRFGMSHRFADAFIFLFGIDIIQGLKLGYSYDLPVTKMVRSGGSHEVSLRYCFKPQFARKSKYKSQRIL